MNYIYIIIRIRIIYNKNNYYLEIYEMIDNNYKQDRYK
jgi:hypothetical protein